MNKIKKVLAGIAALAALGMGGAAIASATGSGSSTDKPEANDAPDVAVAAPAKTQASAAALKAVPGGKVSSVEAADEGGATVYEVKVTKGAKTTEVGLDKAFSVTSQKADDDQGEQADDQGDGDGDGEQAADQGDGDGETNDDGPAAAQTTPGQ